MSRHSQLGMLVHVVGTDLHLYRFALRPDDGRVDGAVVVFLGRGDIVVELSGNV